MRRRLNYILAAVWWALWTMVIIPVHTRGMVPLATGSCPMCCGCEKAAPEKGKAPAKESSENCAICQMAATLGTPPVLPVFTPRLILIGRVEAERAAGAVLDGAPRESLCRGPPAV